MSSQGQAGDPDATRAVVSRGSGDLTPELIEAPLWTDSMLEAAGIPITEVPLVTVGGGLGSFALVNYLRIAGVPTSDIAVLTDLASPEQTYQYLARNSQIPDQERLRSDAGSTMDNIWGFPSYAVREAFEKGTSGFFQPLWNVLGEPILADYYTPKAGQVYRSVQRESQRINWTSMVNTGQVRMIRRRSGGGYLTILTPPEGSSRTKRVAFKSRFVHVAVGYPGIKFLPDLQAYVLKNSDFGRVVNAYSPHDHVYRELLAAPGVVVVRGSGIVASRILQRLCDDIEIHGAKTVIWHLFRSLVSGPQGESRFFRRPGADGFAYQAFNFPKAAWGGQLRDRLLAMPRDERPDWIRTTGGTNTAPRKSWKDQLDRGRAQGFYKTHVGTVEEVVPGPDNTIVTRIRSSEGSLLEVPSNFIIDATGLEGDIKEHRLLADLMDKVGAQTNPIGRLETTPAFEVIGTESPPGRLYASGTATLGSYYTPVDSFLGLQYAALHIVDDLSHHGFGRRIGPVRSIGQWWKWLFGKPL